MEEAEKQMKFTFGNSLAAGRLEELLENDKVASCYVSKVLGGYTHQLLLITLIKEPRTVRLCMELLRDYTLQRFDVSKRLSPIQKTFAKNIVMLRYRAFRKGFDDINRVIQSRKNK